MLGQSTTGKTEDIMNTAEWLRKTHTKPLREWRGVKLEPPTERNPMGCGSGKVQWDSKTQTRRTVRTKQASSFWAWHLKYEKENQ